MQLDEWRKQDRYVCDMGGLVAEEADGKTAKEHRAQTMDKFKEHAKKRSRVVEQINKKKSQTLEKAVQVITGFRVRRMCKKKERRRRVTVGKTSGT